VIVDDTQLSLAIGKKGQNVRLAAKLLGWKIDIKSEEEKRQEVEQQMQDLTGGPSTPIEQVSELGDGIIQKLVAAGITTVEALADMTPEQLEEIPGIGEKTLERISVAVRHYFGQFEAGEEGFVAETAEGASAESATSEEGREAVLAVGEAEAENDAAVITEAESVRAAEEDTEIRTEAEEAIKNVPPADEAEVETLEDQPAKALGEDAQSAEEPLLESIETESATTDEQSAKKHGA
ncbi:MAG: helix-hairpin-helix domain-containing protein, partial [Terracidiphilus sp.]